METNPTKVKAINLVKMFYASLNGHDYVGFLRAKNAVFTHLNIIHEQNQKHWELVGKEVDNLKFSEIL